MQVEPALFWQRPGLGTTSYTRPFGTSRMYIDLLMIALKLCCFYKCVRPLLSCGDSDRVAIFAGSFQPQIVVFCMQHTFIPTSTSIRVGQATLEWNQAIFCQEMPFLVQTKRQAHVYSCITIRQFMASWEHGRPSHFWARQRRLYQGRRDHFLVRQRDAKAMDT